MSWQAGSAEPDRPGCAPLVLNRNRSTLHARGVQRMQALRCPNGRAVQLAEFAVFERRCVELQPGFSITESALAAETVGYLAMLLFVCAAGSVTNA
jgi:hypothetical protein